MKALLYFFTLAGLSVCAMTDVNVSGKWSGTFSVTRSNGESKDSTALLILKQNGNEITGSIGPGEDEQYTIDSGKLDGDKLTIESEHNGMAIKFKLVLADDRITGEAAMSTGTDTATAKVDVKRVK